MSYVVTESGEKVEMGWDLDEDGVILSIATSPDDLDDEAFATLTQAELAELIDLLEEHRL